MQTPDDEQFETYLKRFHPLAPKAIKTFEITDTSRRLLALAAWITALAAVLIAATMIWHTRDSRDVKFVDRHAPLEPLTMRTGMLGGLPRPHFRRQLMIWRFAPARIRSRQGNRAHWQY